MEEIMINRICLKVASGMAAVGIVAAVAGLSAGAVSAQQPAPVEASSTAIGFDFLSTVAAKTSFAFEGAFVIPANFFADGSRPFSGRVAFKGVPIGTFREQKVGNTDTVVERKSMPALRVGGEGRTEIELVALSLASVDPIRVQIGGRTELWDVKVQPSPSHPSTGTLAIRQVSKEGGTAISELTVYPLFTFVARKEGTQKQLDVGRQQLPPTAAGALTLRATNIPWARRCPAGNVVLPGQNDNFCIGVTAKAGVATTRSPTGNRGFAEQSQLASHGLLPAVALLAAP
jgi:hypothetical protein